MSIKYSIFFNVNFYNCGGSKRIERQFKFLEDAQRAKAEIDCEFNSGTGTTPEIFDKYVDSDDGGYFNSTADLYKITMEKID